MAQKVKRMLYRALCEREEEKDYTRTLREITIILIGMPEEVKTEYGFLIFFYRIKTLPLLSYKHFRSLIFDLMGMLDRGEVDGFK